MNAVIDIGSNSVRLMLDKGERVNKKHTITTSLGEGLQHSGRLNETAMNKTLDAIKEFCDLAKKENADEIFIFATEAVRSASNGGELASAIKRETGIEVDIVDGDTEGLLGLLGALDDENDEISVIDIGGASVELIRGNRNRITYSHSAPLGNLRLLDGAGENEEDIEKFIDERITQYGIVTATQAVAIGGTATSLASMALGQTVYDQNQTHGCIITIDELYDLKKRIFSSKNRQADFPTLSVKRARIIGHGVIMLIKMLEYLDLDFVRISELDNMEGYLIYKNKINRSN
ncbi:MAG: hypothetical protein IJY70_03290 [Clostridia bacterium]|nr:hypothetical protein [Clostridia bacterium]